MTDELPIRSDLENVERRVARRRFEPPVDARTKILVAVRVELAKPRAARAASHRWAFAGTVAAALLIGANLSMIGASVTHFLPAQPVSGVCDVGVAIAENRGADWTDDDPRESIALSSPRNLPAIPNLPSSGRPTDFDLSPQGITP